MKRKNRTHLFAVSGLLLIVFTMLFSWQYFSQNSVKAAAGTITINNDSSNGTYFLRSKNIPAYVENILANTSVKWTTSDTSVFRINNSTDSSVSTTGGTITLNAFGIGTATLTAEYTDTSNIGQVLTRIISVPSAISENADFFERIRTDGTETAMILDLKTFTQGYLTLLYDVSAGTNIKWSTANPYVVSMDATGFGESNITGFFRATGTGKTTISVSYAEDGKLVTSSVNVYVGPLVTLGNQVTDPLYVKKGDKVHLGASTENNNATLSDKVSWTLTSETGQILESSTTVGKKYFNSSPYDPNLEVAGRAGVYYLYVYTAGCFKEGDTQGTNLINGRLRQTIKLHVLPEPSSTNGKLISLQVNDTYDVADAFNMTIEDFNKYFDYRCEAPDGGTFANGLFTAQKEGPVKLIIKNKDGMEASFGDFLHGTPQFPYEIEVNVYKGFTLDRSEASIYVGGKLNLSTVYGGNKGKITWSSEDPSSVSVEGKDASAVITGVKATGDKLVVVKASMSLDGGRTLTATCNVRVGTTATSITLNETNLSMRVGATSTISAKFQPATTTTVPLEWLVTDPTIVDINKNSEKSVIVTAKKPGTTILTAVNTDNYITAYCTIRVSQAIESISLNYTTRTMTMSQESIKLRATYLPANATLTDLIWTTSDPTIATVDEGLVTFKAPGSVWITVQPEWNEYLVMAQCYLTIVSSPTAFALDKTVLSMEVGGKETIKPILTAANSTTTIKWKVMDPAVASVTNGEVTAVGVGVTHIVATTAEGLVANCQVSVTQKASGIALSTYNLKLAVGEKVKVTATPNPITSTEKVFTWTAKEPNIANVKDGEVTGVSSGSTIILVKTKSGDIAYLYVNVYDKAKGMTLNYSDRQLAKRKTFTLKPVFVPNNVTNTKVTWKSLNPSIATVSDKGKVTAVKGGAAVITCLSDDGGYLATCLVTVVEPVTSIKLNNTSYKLGVGKTLSLKATITSNSSSNAKVKWSSSNSKIASVSSNGKVTGKRIGECVITAKATDGTGKKATCKIKVVRQVSSISMNKSVLTVMVNKTAKLKATVKPSNASYKTVNWTSSNKEVAIVDSRGNVTGLSVGSCNIKAQAKDNGKKAVTCYVNVVNPVPTSSIIVSAKDLVMIKGQSQLLSYTVTPSNHTDKITFASDNKAVATITSAGKIYARRTGTATISITSSSGKQSLVKVTVIGLNKTVLNLEQYDTETLQVDGVAANTITWYSANPSIATCVGGKVVGRKGGSTTVYARVNGIILSCRVNVKSIR